MLNYVGAAAVAAVLLYWEVRELLTSKADKRRGFHSRSRRLAIRLLLPAAGGLIIWQLAYSDPLPLALPETIRSVAMAIGQIIFWSSVALAFWSRETIGRHWAHAAEYQVVSEQELVTNGPYRYMRHPIYTALLGIFTGAQLWLSSWLLLLSLPLYAFIRWQAAREEELLADTFGQEYERYRRSAGMVLPKL